MCNKNNSWKPNTFICWNCDLDNMYSCAVKGEFPSENTFYVWQSLIYAWFSRKIKFVFCEISSQYGNAHPASYLNQYKVINA